MPGLNIFQKQLLTKSSFFPEVGWDSVVSFIEEAQAAPTFSSMNGNARFSRANIELCFIRATRNSNKKGLASSMQRSQLLEFTLRLA